MKINILIVDESTTISKIVVSAFETKNANVENIAKDKEPITIIESSKPDIVLVDADFSGISGYELSLKIKESEKLNNTAVLLLIGDQKNFNQETFDSCKADDYLSKPFKSDDLVKKVQQILGPRGAESPPIPSEVSIVGKENEEPSNIENTIAGVDDMMSDIISESGLSVNSTTEERIDEGEEVTPESELPEDPLLAMDDIMNDIVGDTNLENIPTSDSKPELKNSKNLAEASIPQKESSSESESTNKTPRAPIKLSLTQKSKKKKTVKGSPTKSKPKKSESKPVVSDSSKKAPPPPKATNEGLNLEEMLSSAEAFLEETTVEKLSESIPSSEGNNESEDTEITETDIPAVSDNEFLDSFEPAVADETSPEIKPTNEMSSESKTPEDAEITETDIPTVSDDEFLDSFEPTVADEFSPEIEPINKMLSDPKAFEDGELSESSISASTSDSLEQNTKEDSLAEVSDGMDSVDSLDSTFETIQQSEDTEKTTQELESKNDLETKDDTRSAFAEDMAQFEIKREPDDLLERLAPSAFNSSGIEGKPNLMKETLSYLSDLSPKDPKFIAPAQSSDPQKPEKNFKLSQPDKQKELSMSTEQKGDLFVQIVGEHIKRILERSLEESIAKEISGLSATIERTVREIVKEVTPEISRSIIQEEIEKIRKLEEV